MKRYRFRLEQVLRVRRVQADLVAVQLAEAQHLERGAAAAETARLDSIGVRARPAGTIGGQQVLADRHVWEAELASLDAAVTEHSARRAATADARDQWIAAHRLVRALELLDDRQREEHRLDAARDEAHRIDDLVASRHALRAQVEAAG